MIKVLLSNTTKGLREWLAANRLRHIIREFSWQVLSELQNLKGVDYIFQNNHGASSRLDSFYSLFENLTDAVIVFNDEGVCLYGNYSALSLFRLDFKEILGMRLEEISQSELLQDMSQKWRNYVTRGTLTGTTNLQLVKEQSIPMDYRIKVHFMDHLNLLILTPHEKNPAPGKNLLPTTVGLKGLFEESAQLFIMLDENMSIQTFNRTAQELAGKYLGSHLQENDQISKYLTKSLVETFRPHIHEVLDGKKVNFEINTDLPLADDVWFLVEMSPLQDIDQRVLGVCILAVDITNNKKMEMQINHWSFNDILTNLPNRPYFVNALDDLMETGTDDFAILYFDLDNFKLINDTLGHQVGDELLVSIVKRLQGIILPDTLLSRFGGDEFALLIPSKDPAISQAQAQQIFKTLRQPFELGNKEIFISLSVGIAPGSKEYGSSQEILRDADAALYQAKARGKNNFVVFKPDILEANMRRLELERDLRRAIANEEFEVFYQPVADISTLEVVGFESLIRWKVQNQFISPDYFLPVAEETGLLTKLDNWVLKKACQQAAIWRDMGYPMRAAVNVSLAQLKQHDLEQIIQSSLSRAGLPHSSLLLELTEHIIVENFSLIDEVLLKLKNMGINLALDDFGTGYSSLVFLKRFPISLLKIDRSFVQDIHVNNESQAIVKATIQLAHALNLKVVAEGVETAAQMAILRVMDCDQIQGYYLSQPLIAKEFTKRLTEGFLSDKGVNVSLIKSASYQN